MEKYCIVIKKEDASIALLNKCVDGQIISVNEDVYWKKMGEKDEVSEFAIDEGVDGTELTEAFYVADNPEETV